MGFLTVGIHVDVLDRLIRMAELASDKKSTCRWMFSDEDHAALESARVTLANFLNKPKDQQP